MLQLMREAEMHLGQLTSMLRAPGVAALPGTVAIVAVKAAGSIAQQRPFFISKVLPVLLGLGLAKVCLMTACGMVQACNLSPKALESQMVPSGFPHFSTLGRSPFPWEDGMCGMTQS